MLLQRLIKDAVGFLVSRERTDMRSEQSLYFRNLFVLSWETVAIEKVVIGTKMQVIANPVITIGHTTFEGAMSVVKFPNIYMERASTANPPAIHARPSIFELARIRPEMMLPRMAPKPRGLITNPACSDG